MDKQKIAYFTQQYSALGFEDLKALLERRDTLADEAQQALDDVIASKGMSPELFSQAVAMSSHKSADDIPAHVGPGEQVKTNIKRNAWPALCMCIAIFIHGVLLSIGWRWLGGAIPAMLIAGLGWFVGTRIRASKSSSKHE